MKNKYTFVQQEQSSLAALRDPYSGPRHNLLHIRAKVARWTRRFTYYRRTQRTPFRFK